MIPLSVVIITLNEERNIKRCLESVVSVADEIIIFDAGSTDNTKEIAESFEQVRFIEHPFETFGKQKQVAVEAARYPTILSIDADEELSTELQDEILEVRKRWLCRKVQRLAF